MVLIQLSAISLRCASISYRTLDLEVCPTFFKLTTFWYHFPWTHPAASHQAALCGNLEATSTSANMDAAHGRLI